MMVRCHTIMETGRTPSRDEIKAAMREMARRYHPDVLRGLHFYRQEKMKAINLAYEALRSGKDVVEVDDAWWDLLSRLELARKLLTRAQELRKKMGTPPASLKENAVLAEQIMEKASAFLEEGTSLSEGALAAYDMGLVAMDHDLSTWIRQREARMAALRSEAEEVLREAEQAKIELHDEVPDADLERAMAAIKSAIVAGNEDLLREHVRKGWVTIMRVKERYEKRRRIRQERILAQERLLRTMQELMDRGFVTRGSFSELCQEHSLAFAEATKADRPAGEETFQKALQEVLALPQIASRIEMERKEGLDRLQKCERFLGKLTGGRGFGVWANLLVWLRGACAEEDVLIMLRASDGIQELHSLLMRNERELNECEGSARRLHEMLEIGYMKGETQKMASLRAAMAIEAGKGDLTRSFRAAKGIVDLAESHHNGFEDHRREWDRLREVYDSVRSKAASVPVERNARFQEIVASIDAAFASGELRQAEDSLGAAKDLLSTTKTWDMASLRQEARRLAAIARSRMDAEECTCCWASPIERRKANALIEVMGRLEDNEAMLEMAVIDMRVFIAEHDSPHDGSREQLREAYEMLLESGILVEAAAQGPDGGRTSMLKEGREKMLKDLARGNVDKKQLDKMRVLVKELRQDMHLETETAHRH